LIDTARARVGDLEAQDDAGGAFGSCRYKLKGIDENRAHYERLIEVFRAHDIGYFFYNGGNDSRIPLEDLASRREAGLPAHLRRHSKTVDNDLAVTDNCPGFGLSRNTSRHRSARRVRCRLDGEDSTRVFVMEVMAACGWITRLAASPPTGKATRRKYSFFRRSSSMRRSFWRGSSR